MKKTIAILLSVIFVMSFCACAKSENRADTSLKDGEIMLSGYVAESYGSSLLLQKADGYDWVDYVSDRAFVNIGINMDFVVDGWYVTDLSPNSFVGEYISVICSETVLETYPAQLQGERMIILLN